MSHLYEELDYRQTPLGELILRRRHYLDLDTDVYEVKLGDDFLMSSLFTASEQALGRLGVAYAMSHRAHSEAIPAPAGGLDVVVGGLGLGYTAAAVLESPAVRSLLVVEYLEPVIEWHRQYLLPASGAVVDDPRCRIVSADFFACAESDTGFDPDLPGRTFDALLVDIDHTPTDWLAVGNSSLYQPAGLRQLSRHLLPSGIFGLWSDELPDGEFQADMSSVFADHWVDIIAFENPLDETEVRQTVYFGVAGRPQTA